MESHRPHGRSTITTVTSEGVAQPDSVNLRFSSILLMWRAPFCDRISLFHRVLSHIDYIWYVNNNHTGIEMADETIIWEGASGTKYKYWIYPLPPNFNASPGNYIFAEKTKTDTYRAIYIGETGDLSERFDDHHAMPCIKREGATHIHVHSSSGGDETRRDEESDLIAKWSPPCNG